MLRVAINCLFAVVLLLPSSVSADPITLKLAFLSSDRSATYLSFIKPFVDAINNRSQGQLKITVYFSGALGNTPTQQSQLVLDGKADIAFIVPGLNPKRYPDNAVIELPGLFRSTREATLTHTRLVAANALRGYEDFFVIGAVGTQPETIHSRKRTASLADVAGQKLRVNNAVAAAAMTTLGASPVVLSLNDTSNAISSGRVDGAVVQLAQLASFGVGRLVNNHYLLGISSAPLALVMNRKTFDNLPGPAQKTIRDHSGEWLATRYIETSDTFNRQVIEKFKADPRRKVVYPTPADQAAARRAFDAVIDKWEAKNAHNRNLLAQVRSTLGKLRPPRE